MNKLRYTKRQRNLLYIASLIFYLMAIVGIILDDFIVFIIPAILALIYYLLANNSKEKESIEE